MDAHDLSRRWQGLMAALPPSARLLAVSKGHPAAAIRDLAALGQVAFGESRVQEALRKQEELADLTQLQWHFIGRLQANKVRQVLRAFGTIHSLDSLALCERVSRIAGEERCQPRVMLQVKLRPDPNKGGWDPEALRQVWPDLQRLPHCSIVGLMTIAPLGLAPEERLALFRDCRQLADDLGLSECSMGMSGDWAEAVSAGATWVRLGSALFGERSVQQSVA